MRGKDDLTVKSQCFIFSTNPWLDGLEKTFLVWANTTHLHSLSIVASQPRAIRSTLDFMNSMVRQQNVGEREKNQRNAIHKENPRVEVVGGKGRRRLGMKEY